MTEAKRKGRPPRSEDGPANRTVTMRVNQRLYDDLADEAEVHSRSLTAQAERRLMYRESHLTRLVGALVDDARARFEGRGVGIELTEAECRRVAHVAVEIAFGMRQGPGDDEIERLTRARLPDEVIELAIDDAVRPYDLAAHKMGKVMPEKA